VSPRPVTTTTGVRITLRFLETIVIMLSITLPFPMTLVENHCR
jgi:hypothetical protein